ncbi:WXG100-like domain-containing protein [Qaidamihabitans albus]|uniref:WXG100-like domain-containing protein n=1 Tax=Qaidamihabitans albus TaxID=2795733 RepID=UPI0018F1ECDF|nr:hypothetical protein [Qaidamihabitans albus]
MTAPSDDGSGAGGGGTDSAGAPPPAAEAEAPPEASPEAPAPAEEEPAPEQDAPADATTASEPADAAPADDGTQAPESGGTEQPGQEAPAADAGEDVPGTIPGGQMRETDDAPGEGAGEEREADGILPLDDEFATTVRNEGPNLQTPAGILDDLGQQWNGTGGDADAAHADGSGGVAAVSESWQDPAQEELRRRTDSSLEETRGVGDSARAMDEQVRRAGEQARAATDAIEQNTARQAPGYYLATSTLPPGERDVAARRIVDITVDGNRDIANQAAANIMNDPGWDRVEAPLPGAGDPTPALYAAGSGALDAGANLLAERHASTVAAQGLDDVAPKVLKAGKVAGGALGLPLAIASAAHDAHAGPPDERESLVQAAASNGAGLLASIAAPAAAGAVAGAVGGAGIGAIPGALIGLGAGVIASGAVDSLFENGFSDPGGALLDGVNSLGDTASSLVDAADSADAAINSKIREAWNALF